jgi:hypothetical protein
MGYKIMKKRNEKIGFVNAAIALTIAMALLLPGAVAFTNREQIERAPMETSLSDEWVMMAENVTAEAGDKGVVVRINGTWSDSLMLYQMALRYDSSKIEVNATCIYPFVTLNGTVAEFDVPWPPFYHEWWNLGLSYDNSLNPGYVVAGAMNYPYNESRIIPAGSGTLFKLLFDIKEDAPSGDVALDLFFEDSNPPKDCAYVNLSAVYYTADKIDGILTITGGVEPNDPPLFSSEDPSNSALDIPITTSQLSVTIEDPEGDSFDWSIETVPNIGMASGTGEYNGTKTCSVSGLTYDTLYTWFVNATDSGSGETTEAVYTFTTESPPPNEPPVFSNENPSDGATDISISTASVSIAIADPEGDLFDWSITTMPDVGSSNGTDEPNGTKTCSITGLAYDTTYTWTVIATDAGSGQTTESAYTFTTETEPTPEPDLDCNGELTWTDVEPGSTVEGSFTVSNIGDPTSALDWEITDEPDWGTWTITPSSGTDLTPEASPKTIEVSVIAPDDQETEFTGEIKIVNSEDSSDTCTISVSLTTPKNKQFSFAQIFLQRLFERFPLLEHLFAKFPLFQHLLIN